MAQYEKRLVDGAVYTVPVGLRADWRPGQPYNPTTTGSSSSSGGSPAGNPAGTYYPDGSFVPKSSGSPAGNPAGTYYPDGSFVPRDSSSSSSSSSSASQRNAPSTNNSIDLESFFDKFMPKNDFVAPSDAQMQEWASTYANTQIDPVIAAIQNSLTRQLAAQDTARSDVEAAYAGLPAQYANQLEEARNAALESAIARGMGRSGVVDWQTEKYSKPILESQRQTDADKAAKLAAIANTIAALNTTAQDSIAAAEGQRGSLEAARMGDLQQWVAGMQAAGSQDSFNNALQLAGMINSNHNTGQDLLLQLLPLFI